MLTLNKFEEASEKVKEVTLETKLIYSEFLSEQTGNKVYLKPENMQLTGAYKVRGAYYKISTLTEEERSKGLITASAGNHAQGVAYAAKRYGCKAVIVMPTGTPLIKVNRTKSYGADVVLYGNVYDEACEEALRLAKEKGYTFVHPFDDLEVATGQGTVGVEVLQIEYIRCEYEMPYLNDESYLAYEKYEKKCFIELEDKNNKLNYVLYKNLNKKMGHYCQCH